MCIAILCTQLINAQTNIKWDPNRPDSHAPISIMLDHYHEKGELMISYRYMPMWMDGNLQSSDEVNDIETFSRYLVSPQEMKMDMHMLGLMYAKADCVRWSTRQCKAAPCPSYQPSANDRCCRYSRVPHAKCSTTGSKAIRSRLRSASTPVLGTMRPPTSRAAHMFCCTTCSAK